jgi:hypothetical protein
MGVYRPEFPGDRYTQVPNDWLRDPRTSWKAKGIAAYLLSHRPGYRISQNQMIRESKDGRDALLSGLRELEEAGYLTPRPSRLDAPRGDAGQYAEHDYELRDPFAPPVTANLDGIAPNRSGDPTVAENPSRKTRDGSPEHKKTKREDQVTPSELRAGQLALVQATAADRKKALGSLAAAVTHEHVDACGGLANYLAVLGIVKRCLDVPATGGGSAAGSGASPRYTDEQVRKALAELRAAGRPVTLQTMQATLDGTPARRTVPAPPPNNYHPDVPIWERM